MREVRACDVRAIGVRVQIKNAYALTRPTKSLGRRHIIARALVCFFNSTTL